MCGSIYYVAVVHGHILQRIVPKVTSIIVYRYVIMLESTRYIRINWHVDTAYNGIVLIEITVSTFSVSNLRRLE